MFWERHKFTNLPFAFESPGKQSNLCPGVIHSLKNQQGEITNVLKRMEEIKTYAKSSEGTTLPLGAAMR